MDHKNGETCTLERSSKPLSGPRIYGKSSEYDSILGPRIYGKSSEYDSILGPRIYGKSSEYDSILGISGSLL
jgi:hypothetical protein